MPTLGSQVQAGFFANGKPAFVPLGDLGFWAGRPDAASKFYIGACFEYEENKKPVYVSVTIVLLEFNKTTVLIVQ